MHTKWTEETIIDELVKIKDMFPAKGFTQRLLRLIKRGDLSRAIDHSGYGIGYFQEKLGYKPDRPKGYWSNIDNVLDEMRPLIRDGMLPTIKILKQEIGSKIADVIAEYGGIDVIADKLGCQAAERSKGFWYKWENIENMIRPHIVNDRFPTQTFLIANIKGRIGNAIAFFGGIEAVAERMGYKVDHIHQATDGHYLNSVNELIFDEYLFHNNIPHEVNEEICSTSKHRFDFKIKDVYVEIWGYEKDRTNSSLCLRYNIKREDKEKLYNFLGLKTIFVEADVFKKPIEEIHKHFEELLKECGVNNVRSDSPQVIQNTIKHAYYWTVDKIVDELKEIASKLGKMPTSTELLAMNKGGLKDAISRHGGLHHFAEMIGLECDRKPDHYWNDITISDHLTSLIVEIGEFPTFNKMEELKKYDLIRAINRNGGLHKFRKIFGAGELCKPRGYYTKEIIIQRIKEMTNQLGHFPLYIEIRQADKTLSSALDRLKIKMPELKQMVEGQEQNADKPRMDTVVTTV